MRRGLILLGVFIVLLVAPSVIRYLNYNSFSTVDRGEIPTYDPVEIVEPESPPPSGTFVDEPEEGEGLILLDVAHDNAFELDELGFLNGRLSARGFKYIPYSGGNLASQLRSVNAFVVITPLSPFTIAEIQAVKDFVNRGGRLLLLGDPTRYEISIEEDLFEVFLVIEDDKIPLNSLGSEFDITFKGDYLYNMSENEGNFKNIMLSGSNIGESDLTEALETVVFYGAHSLDVGPTGTALFSGGDDTWSSATDRSGGLTLGATSQDGRVLALSDIHFMTDPYHTSYDNGRLVAHIADFLSETSERVYTLPDFPYFYADETNLVYVGGPQLGPLLFDQVIDLQNAFQTVGKKLTLVSEAEAGEDTLYLGLYNQVDDQLLEILASNGISLTIEPPVLTEAELAALEEEEAEEEDAEAEEDSAEESETEEPTDDEDVTEEETPEDEDGEDAKDEKEEEEETVWLVHSPLGNVQMSGTAVVLLDDGGNGRRSVVVLAASQEGLNNTVELLQGMIPLDADYTEAGCIVQENIALCPSNVSDEEVEAELDGGGQPEDEEAEEETEEDEEETEEEEDGEEEEETPPAEDLDAENQGTISLGETIEAELEAEVSHAWTFNEGPVVIDIILESSDELDAVLEIYDPDNNFITSSDSTFTGETEELIGVEIEDDGDYTIVVRDYYDDGGSYTLTVIESDVLPEEGGEEEEEEENGNGSGDEEGSTIENIFIFVDDGGEPLSTGFTSADAFIDLLGADYEITTWVSSIDGPLEEDTMEGTDLLIWDSGDYRDEDAFFEDDIFILFDFLDSGAPFFITGSSPALLSEFELALVSDLEIIGDDEILLDGFTMGDIIVLDDSYETVFSETIIEDQDNGDISLFARGPGSAESGEIIAIASIDSFTEQRSVILLLPFVVLPEEEQITMMDNLMTWFAEGSSE